MRRPQSFHPLRARGRRVVVGILVTFALSSALSVGLSIWSTSRSQHKAAVVEVAGRQRTLAERYVEAILLARSGRQSDPFLLARDLRASAAALLNGGLAPSIFGDDDSVSLQAERDTVARAQLVQEVKLVH